MSLEFRAVIGIKCKKFTWKSVVVEQLKNPSCAANDAFR